MILNEIATYAKERVLNDIKKVSCEEIRGQALDLPRGGFRFYQALKSTARAIICEVKKASPSKGIISQSFDYIDIACEYERIGATAISVLTEPKWFLGSDEIFCQIRDVVRIPLLRKDFTVDKYQIYQAKVMGADSILLICSLLSQNQLEEYLGICDEMGIDALVETHNKDEIRMANNAQAKIIGVNNRNLNNFHVDISNAVDLKRYIDSNALYVAESGVLTVENGLQLFDSGADALLIGEAFMKSDDKGGFIRNLRGAS